MILSDFFKNTFYPVLGNLQERDKGILLFLSPIPLTFSFFLCSNMAKRPVFEKLWDICENTVKNIFFFFPERILAVIKWNFENRMVY